LDVSNVVPPASTKASKICRHASGPALVSAVPKLAVPSAYSETRSPGRRPRLRPDVDGRHRRRVRPLDRGDLPVLREQGRARRRRLRAGRRSVPAGAHRRGRRRVPRPRADLGPGAGPRSPGGEVYAEAALSPALAAIVTQQLATLRAAVAELLPERHREDAANLAEAFVAVCVGYNQQLAVRGDLDPAPFTEALMALLS
jgi:hypothetical protein